jgi:hypothetical protein
MFTHVPVQLPLTQTMGLAHGLPLTTHWPSELHNCGWFPSHCFESGVHIPAHAEVVPDDLQTKGHCVS